MVSDPQLTQLVHSGTYRIVGKPDFHHVSLVALANTPWVRYVPAADNTARPGRLVWSVAA